MRELKLLTLISYRFLPARLGGNLAHLHLHNALSYYLQNIVAGRSSNDTAAEKEKVKFELIPLFKNQVSTYLPFSHSLDLIKLIQNRKIDAIMCAHPYLGPAAYLASRWTGIPLINYSYNIESERFRSIGKIWWPLLFLFEKWVLKKSKLVFFVTEEDKQWAIKHYGLPKQNCVVMPVGISFDQVPVKSSEKRKLWMEKGLIGPTDKILYFIGAYNYQPNVKAVSDILREVVPRLKQKKLGHKIFIVGSGLPEPLIDEIKRTNGQVVYLGFVEEISDVLEAADVMLNPMTLGGGIKTKAVEALGHNIAVVSTADGAKGLLKEVCGEMLYVSPDSDWDQFVSHIEDAAASESKIPAEFYQTYSWSAIGKRVTEAIGGLIN